MRRWGLLADGKHTIKAAQLCDHLIGKSASLFSDVKHSQLHPFTGCKILITKTTPQTIKPFEEKKKITKSLHSLFVHFEPTILKMQIHNRRRRIWFASKEYLRRDKENEKRACLFTEPDRRHFFTEQKQKDREAFDIRHSGFWLTFF